MSGAVTDADRVHAMLKGRRAVQKVPFPGMDGQAPVMVGIRVLTGEEIDEARLDGIQYVQSCARARSIDPVQMLQIDSEVLDAEVQRALIFRAVVTDAINERGERVPFFSTPTQVRQLDSVMFATWFQVYLEAQEKVNPLVGKQTPEQIEELADALSKEREGEASSLLLSLFDAPTLRRLLRSMASRLSTSRGGS